jgi:hypothetical protein
MGKAMTEEEKIERGQRAARILDDSILKEAFIQVEADYLEKFSSLHPSKSDEMAEINRSLRNLKLVKDKLRSVVTEGKVSEKLMDKIKRKVSL